MNDLLIAKSADLEVKLLPKMANRHGVITGATGTGKTVTLKVLAEHFSSIGVPVFVSDVKGDFSGIARPGERSEKLDQRLTNLGYKPEEFQFYGTPVEFWDVFGEQGTPVRTTVSEMGPLMLARLLDLNETQTGVLNIVFRIADDQGLLLIDLKDLRSMLQFVGENAREFETQYGNVASATVGSIQRALLGLEDQGGDIFFGEPNIQIHDFIRTDSNGKGVVNILAADKLMHSPKIYATFLLWLLSELFEELPEVGDPEKPKMVYFFDEAHLLFSDAPQALLDKIEQVVKLIRSKGIGVYFITQNPLDIPDPVLAQMGNRIQHALRAYTPREQKAVRAAASAFRVNDKIDTERAITELEVGEALISVLDEKGAPTVVQRAMITPPHSRFSPIDQSERNQILAQSMFMGKYKTSSDRESAFEILKRRLEERAQREAEQKAAEAQAKEAEKLAKESAKKGRGRMSIGERVISNVLSSAGRQLGTRIMRGVLGSILK